MTLNANPRRDGPYVGTGLIVPFGFSFKIFEDTDLLVVRAELATGVTTDLVLDSDYSVFMNPDQENNPGGTVSYLVGGVPTALPATQSLTIVGNLPFTQPTDITNQGGFYPQVIEDSLDRVTMLVQQNNDAVERSLQLNVATDQDFDVQMPAPVPGFLLGWGLDGLSLVNYDGTETAPVVAAALAQYIADVADASNAAKGDALIGVKQPFTGSVARTQHQKNADTVSLADAGVIGDGIVDDTAAFQAAIDSGASSLLGSPGKTYKITSKLVGRSNLTIDLQGSTIEWGGAVFSNANKAQRWDNAVIALGTVAPGPVTRNFKVINGRINCNDWGCAVFVKQCEGVELSDLIVTNAQCGGLAVLDCINFTISRNKLIDCAANPTSGFNPVDLEAWSDGIFVFYGARGGEVSANQVINTRVATGRCGICVDDALAGSVESGRKTSAIKVFGNYVSGYDRQAHAEYCYATSFDDNEFVFVASGIKTFNCAFIDWNTEDTTWSNNRCRTVRTLAMISGSTNCLVRGGSMKKTGADTGNAFTNQSAILSTVKFDGVDIDIGASDANIYRWNVLFENCKLSATAWKLSNAYESAVRMVHTTVTNVYLHMGSGLSTDTYEYEDCTFVGFSGANYIAAAPAGKGTIYVRRAKLPAGDVRFFSVQGITFTDMELFNLPTIDGSPAFVLLDGEFLMSSVPVSGSWIKGQKLRNTNPAPSTNYGWVCTTSGTPGTWKTYGAIAA